MEQHSVKFLHVRREHDVERPGVSRIEQFLRNELYHACTAFRGNIRCEQVNGYAVWLVVYFYFCCSDDHALSGYQRVRVRQIHVEHGECLCRYGLVS